MTFEERLGFAVTRELLDLHNDKIKEANKKFNKIFAKISDEVFEKGIKLFELESALEEYLDIIKGEYYEAGKIIDGIIQDETFKKQITKVTA